MAANSLFKMKTKIVISRTKDGKQSCKYVGEDTDKAIDAGKKAAAAGLESFLFIKPFHAKRFAAIESKSKK
jgi:hypothetical protein